ncbi:MAG: hypothetical protein JKY90_05485 [Gammaproteobacteria bacterium]|nr:hypothetical protein [Gammaproteobacteria bacterium]
MKFIKMLPLLLGMLFAAGSYMSVVVADTSVIAAASGAASHASKDPNSLMKDAYFYKETNDTFALKFVIVGISIALLFTLVSIVTGAGKNKG